jgi:hypothetical protein
MTDTLRVIARMLPLTFTMKQFRDASGRDRKSASWNLRNLIQIGLLKFDPDSKTYEQNITLNSMNEAAQANGNIVVDPRTKSITKHRWADRWKRNREESRNFQAAKTPNKQAKEEGSQLDEESRPIQIITASKLVMKQMIDFADQFTRDLMQPFGQSQQLAAGIG